MATKRTSKAANIAQADGAGQPEQPDKTDKLQKLLLEVDEALPLIGGISRSKFLRERKRGRIRAINVGRRVFVPYWELQRYVRMLCDEQGVPLDDAALAG